MKIELAKNFGFCFGVKRAIAIAENSPNSSTIGELIHNNLEISRLQKDFKVKTLKSISELSDEKKVIIRTHGIRKQDLEFLKKNHFEISDATCPFVKKPQKIAQDMSEKGYDIVIFGDIQHPEIQGIMSYVSTNVFVVANEEDIEKIKFKSKIALISQTTKKIEKFNQIAVKILPKVKELRIFNTICNATLQNQEAIEILAKKSDVMVIVGGKNSSNTRQLFLISKNFCEDSYLIESENEVKGEWFLNKNLCGISAGASTPDWLIQKVIEKIKNLDEKATIKKF